MKNANNLTEIFFTLKQPIIGNSGVSVIWIRYTPLPIPIYT